jgi:hypothetical protein
MSRFIWSTLRLSSLILTATLVLADCTQAAETKVVNLAQNQTFTAISGKSNLVTQLK